MSLPSHYFVMPAFDSSNETEEHFLAALESHLAAGGRLVQFRAKGLAADAYRSLALRVVALVHRYDGKVLLNAPADMVKRVGADGLHLDSKAFSACDSRPLPDSYLVAASGHSLAALKRAEQIGASFAVLSPVKYTKAHPDLEPIGWSSFAQIVAQLAIPVFALGGVSAADAEDARQAGAQGIAGRRCY